MGSNCERPTLEKNSSLHLTSTSLRTGPPSTSPLMNFALLDSILQWSSYHLTSPLLYIHPLLFSFSSSIPLLLAMVSFHSPQWQKHEFTESFSNKRKRGDDQFVKISAERSQQRAKNMNSLLGNELPLMAPLPLEWQRCLDIKVNLTCFNSFS